MLQHIEHAVRVQDGKITLAVEQRQIQGVDGQFIRQRVDFLKNMGFYNFVPLKGQKLAIIRPGKVSGSVQAVGGRERSERAAVVLHLRAQI